MKEKQGIAKSNLDLLELKTMFKKNRVQCTELIF